MLQQTQTDRVVGKYLAWMERFPTPSALAEAPLSELLSFWSGLGYNRRALSLARAAALVSERGGSVPDTEEALLELPGVGPYTARAVLAFAFGIPTAFIETNIRSVFLHHFFTAETGVSDARIRPLVEKSLDRADPRSWYYALMDYGVEIKRRFGNPNVRSGTYAKQSPFADSNRRIRGALLRELCGFPPEVIDVAQRELFAAERSPGSGDSFGQLESDRAEGGEAQSSPTPKRRSRERAARMAALASASASRSADELAAALPFARERVEAALFELVNESFVVCVDGRYLIRDSATFKRR